MTRESEPAERGAFGRRAGAVALVVSATLLAADAGAQQNQPQPAVPPTVITGAPGAGQIVRPAVPGGRVPRPAGQPAPPPTSPGNTPPPAGQPGTTPPAPAPAPTPAPPPEPPPRRTTPLDTTVVPEEAQLQSNIEFESLPSGAWVDFNLQDVDLPVLVRIISNITGRRFILGAKARSIKATIYSGPRVTVGEAYRAFLAVLQSNGMTIVPAGRYYVITESAGAAQEAVPTYRDGEAMPAEARMVTRIHRLSNVSADEMANLLNRFKSRDGDVTPYPPTNTIIITDFGNNVQRLLLIVQELDVAGTGERIWVEPVHYADAQELAQKIQEVFEASGIAATAQQAARGQRAPVEEVKPPGQQGEPGERETMRLTKVIADPRTNSLIVVATQPAYMQVLELIRRLDVPVAGEGEIHVHPLQHADAEELAGVLNSLVTGSSAGRVGGRPPGPPGAAPAQGEAFAGEVRIQSDAATNSLVIVSSPRDYAALRQVISQLDIARRQVFVEAVIMEVSLERLRNVGISFHGGDMVDTGGEESLVYGGFYPLQTISIDPTALTGLAVGIRGFELEGSDQTLLPGVSIPAFGVLLSALQTDNDVNVLSTPNILATDNVAAEIMVGGNIPVQQGGYGGLGSLAALAGQAGGSAASQMSNMYGGLNPYVSVGYQRVGITLKITPQINESDQVRLEIELEVSEVTGESELGPIIGQKTAKTTSVVRDQQTVVIGGLMTDSEVETVEKVPVLGDIPILGYLFRHTRTRQTKRNLLIFLTPYIIRDPSDFRRIFNRKMEERREFIEQISSLREREWSPDIDYSRTNGLLEEINQTVRDLEEEEALRLQMELEPPPEHRPSEPISATAWEALVGEDYVEIAPEPQGRPVLESQPISVQMSPGMRAGPTPSVVY